MESKLTDARVLWFLDELVTFRVAESEGQDRITVLEHLIAEGSSPPLHIHTTEDEVIHVLEGALRFKLDDAEHVLNAGDIALAPKGIPHTFRATAPEGCRFLTTTTRGDFEGFVREVGRPAERAELPEPPGEPTPEALEALAAIGDKYGIEFVGPPLA